LVKDRINGKGMQRKEDGREDRRQKTGDRRQETEEKDGIPAFPPTTYNQQPAIKYRINCFITND
jgi:hypothetical protein